MAQPAITLEGISPAEIRRAKPGHVLRVYPQIGGALNAKAFRLIYRSTGLNGEPIAVSGTVIYPVGPPPKGGRDVIAWAHYTTGVAERCAPTLLPNLGGTIPGLEQMLGKGYAVVATDYEGLGVPGVHAYLVGVSEARSVLDRCARRASSPTCMRRTASSCGAIRRAGHAAFFTGALAATYAPELKLLGIAAAAPAVNLVELFKGQKASIAGDGLVAMALLSWSRTYNIPVGTVLEDGAEASFERVAESCIQSISQMLSLLQLAKPLKKTFLKGDPTTIPIWREMMEKNSISTAPPGVPCSSPRDRRQERQRADDRRLCQEAVRRRRARGSQAAEGRLA